MHEFFDKLGAAAKRAAGNVANEVNVAAEKQKLSDCYKDLGKLCYQALKKGEKPDFADEVAKIDAALKRIEALRERRNVTNVDVPAEDPKEEEPNPEPTAEEPKEEEPNPEPTAEEPDFVLVDAE